MFENKMMKLVMEELDRESKVINLIPSESPMSPLVKNILATDLHQKYAEGYPQKRYYNGCKIIDKIEEHTIKEICKCFKTNFANVQPHSGSTANQAAYKAAERWFFSQGLKANDAVIPTLSMDLDAGGHLSHFSKASFSSKFKDSSYFSTKYGILPDGRFDYAKIEEWVENNNFGIVVIGASSYPLDIPYKNLSLLLNKSGKHFFIVFDISHIAGLIVAGLKENPMDYYWGNDNTTVITSTTHKTYGGIRHAVICWNDDSLTKHINHAVFPELQGGANFAIISALGAWSEWINTNKANYVQMQQNILDNLQKLIKPLKDKLVLGKSENHLALVRCKSKEHAQKVADKLEESNIIVNVNGMFDGSWGIRIGSTYETLRCSTINWEQIGEFIKYLIENID